VARHDPDIDEGNLTMLD